MATTPVSPMLADRKYVDMEIPLRLRFCRFESGKLVKQDKLLSEIDYVAISHTWGKADWRDIRGIEDKVLASKEKAAFMRERLPSIVGTEYFWMDILCVDQRNPDDRVAVTQHIPAIFRRAKRTIVVRDNTDLRDCCVRVLGDEYDSQDKLATHMRTEHKGRVRMEEGALGRLWLLQEIILSDCIQFVPCNDTAANPKDTPKNTKCPVHSIYQAVARFLSDLSDLASAWARYGNGLYAQEEHCQQIDDFRRAFLNYKMTTRVRDSSRDTLSTPWSFELLFHLSSLRRTSHARDFILAIMPQYKSYKVPSNARKMSFGELFIDFIEQHRSYGPIEPLLRGAIGDPKHFTLFPPAADIPEPLVLGDLVKLCSGPSQRIDDAVGTFIPVRRVDGVDATEALRIIREAKRRSPEYWKRALRTDLPASISPHRALPSYLREFNEACSTVWVAAHDLTSHFKDDDTHESWINAIRIASLISCGLGLSAFEWSKHHLTPVLALLQEESFLILVPNSVAVLIPPISVSPPEPGEGSLIYGKEAKNLYGMQTLRMYAVDPLRGEQCWAPCIFPSLTWEEGECASALGKGARTSAQIRASPEVFRMPSSWVQWRKTLIALYN